MNRSSIVALTIGAMLFGCGAGMVTSQVWISDAHAYEGQTWEYNCLALWNNPKYLTELEGRKQLRELGEAGWEMVQTGVGFADITTGVTCFKRPGTGSSASPEYDYEDE